MTTAILYARYSPRPTKSRRAAQVAGSDLAKNSCDVQIADLRRFCADKGYTVREYLIFRDDARSGKSLRQRKGLRRALKRCKPGMVFVCRDVSRLARNMLDAFMLVRKLTRRKVRFDSINDGDYDPNDTGKLIGFGCKAVIREVDRIETARNTKRAHLRAQYEQLERRSGKIPYGFEPDDTGPRSVMADGTLGGFVKIRESAEEQANIKSIVDWYVGGLTITGVVAKLTENGRSCRGSKWHPSTVLRILRRQGVVTRPQGLRAVTAV